MKLQKLLITILAILITPPTLALAGISPPTATLVAKYPDLFAWIYGVGGVGALAILGMMVNTGHQNNKEQWKNIEKNRDDITGVKVDVAELRGAHEANHPQFRREYDHAPARRD